MFRDRWRLIVSVCLACAAVRQAQAYGAAPAERLSGAKRIVFLGDSITAAGRYVAIVDAWLAATKKEAAPRVLDLGLPSETVSGLSEEGHAGGKFPRPDLAERLERVLHLTKPDLVVACYGINCGIYEPFDAARFERFQQGMEKLQSSVEGKRAKLIIITPPCYDDQRAPKGFSYNEVLARYSAWLIEQRQNGWSVIDLHGPMSAELQKRRQADPAFTFQPDGVHPNDDGHWFIARQVIRGFGDERAMAAKGPELFLRSLNADPEILPLIQMRVDLLRNAYVNAAGHKRPGLAAKRTVPEADQEAEKLTAEIRKLLAKGP